MDNSPPRNGLIFLVTIGSVATLIAIKPAFDVYFDGMFGAAVDDRLEIQDDLAQLNATRARWDRDLSAGSTPIDQAMGQLAERGRTSFPPIRPQAGDEMNMGPLEGWNQRPSTLPPAVEAARAVNPPANEAPAPEPAPGDATGNE